MNKNYRDTIVHNSADYQSRIRDERIYNIGMRVLIMVPIVENDVNEYNDFDYKDGDYLVKETYIEPRFSNYYQVLNILGQSAEDTLPLEISILTNEHMPKDTIIKIKERNTKGNDVYRDWRILSTETKQIGNFYSRLAYAVPARVKESIVVEHNESLIPEYNFDINLSAINSENTFTYNLMSPSIIY